MQGRGVIIVKILELKEFVLLESLASQEAEIINKFFSISEAAGLMMLSNSLTSFEDGFIKPKYGNVINSFCSEYRTFIISLLKNINENHIHIAFSEILIHKVKKINDIEMLTYLKEAYK